MYQSTYKVIPYQDAPAPYPAGGFKACPSIYVEAIFRLAPVKKPEELQPVKFLIKCLTTEFMEAGVDLLGDEGLFTRRDADGNEAIHVYSDRDELQARGDELVKQLRDDPTLTVTVAAWEWLADYQNRPADSSIASAAGRAAAELVIDWQKGTLDVLPFPRAHRSRRLALLLATDSRART